jgi:Rad3-related DNA helicase
MLLAQLRKLPGCDQGAVEEALMANEQFFGAVALLGTGDKFVFKPNSQVETWGDKLTVAAIDNVIYQFDNPNRDERAEKLLELLDNAACDLRSIINAADPNRVYWVEHPNSKVFRVTLHATPIDVAPYLSQNLFKNEDIASIIMTSATLSAGGSFSYLKKAIGCDEAREVCVDSPFDYYNQCLLYLPPNLPDPKNLDFHRDVAPFIEEILLKTDGRAFVLFTSYRGLNEVYDSWQTG